MFSFALFQSLSYNLKLLLPHLIFLCIRRLFANISRNVTLPIGEVLLLCSHIQFSVDKFYYNKQYYHLNETLIISSEYQSYGHL